jgi:hypothetical protein
MKHFQLHDNDVGMIQATPTNKKEHCQTFKTDDSRSATSPISGVIIPLGCDTQMPNIDGKVVGSGIFAGLYNGRNKK